MPTVAGCEGIPGRSTKTTKPTRQAAATAATHLKSRSGERFVLLGDAGQRHRPVLHPDCRLSPRIHTVRLVSPILPPPGRRATADRASGSARTGLPLGLALRRVDLRPLPLAGGPFLGVLVDEVPPRGHGDPGEDRPLERVEPAEAVARERPAAPATRSRPRNRRR